MDITVSQEQGRRPITVFHIQGDIDHSSYEQLQTQAKQAITAGTHDLVLDMQQVTYVSSAGIRAIMVIFKSLRTDSPEESDEAMGRGLRDGTFKSPHLKLASLSPHVAEALKTAGVDMLLEIHPHLSEAIASF